MSTEPTLCQHEQFVALFVSNEAAIHSFVLSMIPSSADADEVLQEASMTMWRRFDQYTPGTSFRNWAFQIAKYTAYNFVRKRARDRHRFSEKVMTLLVDQAEREQDDREARRRVLDHCVAKLETTERTLLSGVYREGSSIKAFAAEQGRTANAVGKQLARIRKSLILCVRQTLRTEVAT